MIAARIAAAHALGILPGQGPASCEVAPPPAPTGPALESEFERLSATVDLLLEPFRGMLQRLGPTTFSRVRDGIVRFVVAVRSRADLAPTCSEGCMPDRR